MAPAAAISCLNLIPADKAGEVVGTLAAHTAARLLRRMPPEARRAVLEKLPAIKTASLRRLLRYPEGTVGSLIDSSIPTLPNDVTVKEGRVILRNYLLDAIPRVYIVGRDQKFMGIITARELAAAPAQEHLRFMTNTGVPALSSHSRVSIITAHPAWREHDELPVIDSDGILLGALTHRRLRMLLLDPADYRSSTELDAMLGLSEVLWLGLYGILEGAASALEGKRDE